MHNKLNDFQKAMIKNNDVAWEIVKIFHPDILEEYPHKYKEGKMISTKDRLRIESIHDWITIKVSCQGHVDASIGIKFECNLSSGSKPLHLFENELKNNRFRAWRFYDDSKSVKGIVPKSEANGYNDKVNALFIEHKIPKPTAQQMSDYYHRD